MRVDSALGFTPNSFNPNAWTEPKHAENTQETPWAALWRDGASLLPYNHQTWRKLLILKGLVDWLVGRFCPPDPPKTNDSWGEMGRSFFDLQGNDWTMTLLKTNSSPLKNCGWETIFLFGARLFSGATCWFSGEFSLNHSPTQSLTPTSADFPTGMSFVLSKWIIAPYISRL